MRIDPARFMIPGGLNDVQASLLALQIESGNIDGDQLCRAMVFTDWICRELDVQAKAGTIDTLKLHGHGMVPQMTEAILKAFKDANYGR